MTPLPSSNWLALKKKLPTKDKTDRDGRPKKRRKTESEVESETSGYDMSRRVRASSAELSGASTEMDRNPDSVPALRRMVYGEESYSEVHKQPGKYIAIDCEMVGIAGDPSMRYSTARDKGDESSLARVSVVNYYGCVLLDTFVRQRERVTDWRTAVSGVRESDMVNAKSFSEVQKLVAALLKDRILVGHAVHNDLQALLLSHPHNMTRDTQVLAGKHGTVTANKLAEEKASIRETAAPIKRNKRQALRRLVMDELGIDVQSGEHSSVIDARATMAIYRIHKKFWDKGFVPLIHKIKKKKPTVELTAIPVSPTPSSEKRKRTDDDTDDDDEAAPDQSKAKTDKYTKKPKKQRISSGLSVIVKNRKGGTQSKQVVSGTRSGVKPTGGGGGGSGGSKWWATLSK